MAGAALRLVLGIASSVCAVAQNVEGAPLSAEEREKLSLAVRWLANRRCASDSANADVMQMNALETARANEMLRMRTPHRIVRHSLWNFGYAEDPWVPCADEEARWWVPGQFRAVAKWTHCCNKLPAVTKCVGNQYIEGGGYTDDVAVCRSYLPASLTPETCVVYSFGIANAWGFDDSMADAGCTVHSFDPTTKTRAGHEAHVHERVSFHYTGLRGRPDDSSQAVGNAKTYYGALGGRRLDLGEIMEELGHKRVDVIKLDCEGCEWEAFAHLATTCVEINLWTGPEMDRSRLLDWDRLLYVRSQHRPGQNRTSSTRSEES